MSAVSELSKTVGVVRACSALEFPRANFYRWLKPTSEPKKPRPSPPRTLTIVERTEVLCVLNSERFVDLAPREVYAELLDEQVYLASVRTMYRILEENGEVRERRDQLRHPEYKRPELLATGPNQVWSWDITKLLGPAKWVHYYLYVVLDIFSRFVVGWMVSERQSAAVAERFLKETIEKHNIPPGQLVIHSDRGPNMTAKSVAFLLADLGITKSHSRPYVSDDNPFSEAQFKTIKYSPQFPERFGCPEDARGFSRVFFSWYNWHHHHSALGLLTPGVVHYGRAEEVLRRRQETLDAAYAAHPERFVRKPPKVAEPPKEVWINPPRPEKAPDALRTGDGLRGRPLGGPGFDDLGSARSQTPREIESAEAPVSPADNPSDARILVSRELESDQLPLGS